MAKDGKKAAIGLGIAGAVSAVIYALTRKKPPVIPPGEGGASIEITILDAEGNPVPQSSPADLVEGATYTVRLTITNQSTKGGVPWAATLTCVYYAVTNIRTLIPTTTASISFAADEAKVTTLSLVIPIGSGGESGEIKATVKDPTGAKLAEAITAFYVTIVAIIYGATVVIGV